MIPHPSYHSTHVQCSDCPIRHRAVCARCDSGELQDLDALKYYRTIPAGQGIIWAGDTMDFVASIVSGIATLLAIIVRRDASLNLRGRQGMLEFDLPLTREAMADYLGLTLETVSRQVSALKRDGVIVLSGKRHIVIPDLDRLMEETGDDSDGGLPV